MKNFQDLLNQENMAAIVTCESKGIGYGIVYRLAEAGVRKIL